MNISLFLASHFVLLLAFGMIPSPANAQDLTAREVIARIQQKVGLDWQEGTVDTFKSGNPDAIVTGIAVTMMATYDVLERAVADGHNLIITHEPTFYGHYDQTGELTEHNDPIYAAKAALIDEHGLIIWRFHDYWHERDPDGIRVGMIKKLGWDAFPEILEGTIYKSPPTSIEKLARDIKERFDIGTMRVVGDPQLVVTNLAFAPGFPGFEPQRRLLARDDVEVLVMGEAHEWETILYGADAVAAGMNKALIIMGHIPSEQAGMEECAKWLRTFIPEMPIAFVPTPEPFWAP